MFPELREALESFNYGVHGYERLSRLAFQEAKVNDEYSLPLFVLGELAQSFANRFDCEPLTVLEAEQQRGKFNRYLNQLDKSTAASADEKVQMLSQMIKEELNQ